MVDSQRPPAFTGLVAHRDPEAGFSLLLPDGWHRLDLPDTGGTLYTPDQSDPTTGLEIGDTLHISQIKLPKGAKAANADDDFTVATIVAPSAMKAEEEETATAEGEVPIVGEEEAEAEGGEAEGGEEA